MLGWIKFKNWRWLLVKVSVMLESTRIHTLILSPLIIFCKERHHAHWFYVTCLTLLAQIPFDLCDVTSRQQWVVSETGHPCGLIQIYSCMCEWQLKVNQMKVSVDAAAIDCVVTLTYLQDMSECVCVCVFGFLISSHERQRRVIMFSLVFLLVSHSYWTTRGFWVKLSGCNN